MLTIRAVSILRKANFTTFHFTNDDQDSVDFDVKCQKVSCAAYFLIVFSTRIYLKAKLWSSFSCLSMRISFDRAELTFEMSTLVVTIEFFLRLRTVNIKK